MFVTFQVVFWTRDCFFLKCVCFVFRKLFIDVDYKHFQAFQNSTMAKKWYRRRIALTEYVRIEFAERAAHFRVAIKIITFNRKLYPPFNKSEYVA